MRRGLTALSLGLLISGLELSAQTFSVTVGRIQAGFAALAGGAEFHVGPARFVTGVVFLGVGLVLVGLIVWSARAQAQVGTVGTMCPQCGNETRRVKRKEWQRLLSALLGERLTRRRCDSCHWAGLSLRH